MTYNPIPHNSTHDYRDHIRKTVYEQLPIDKEPNGKIREALLAIAFVVAMFSVPFIIGWLAEVFQ